jgi:hypothetical protein
MRRATAHQMSTSQSKGIFASRAKSATKSYKLALHPLIDNTVITLRAKVFQSNAIPYFEGHKKPTDYKRHAPETPPQKLLACCGIFFFPLPDILAVKHAS